MIALEYKIKGKQHPYNAIDDTIRTTQFVRNKAIRYWMDAPRELKIDKFALNKYSTELRKDSICRKKARKLYAKKHLKVNRQRNEHAKRMARNLCKFNDLVAYENLRVANIVKNHCLAKSISDASWYLFRQWMEYFAVKFDKVAVAVAPHYTSQKCCSCGVIVKKSLSTRTHKCVCGSYFHRDINAAINILNLVKARGGHPQSNATGVEASTLLGESARS
jgi:putative transposase